MRNRKPIEIPEQKNCLIGGRFPEDVAMYNIKKIHEIVEIANDCKNRLDIAVEALEDVRVGLQTFVMDQEIIDNIIKTISKLKPNKDSE